MAEKPFDARELVEALSGDAAGENATSPSSTSTPPPPPKPLTIEDLPKEILVSILMATEDPFWVRHTFPLVCKAWNELYLSKDASPLHEALEVDFRKEHKTARAARKELAAAVVAATESTEEEKQAAAAVVAAAENEEEDESSWPFCRSLVHASRVLSWAERRASSVHKLLLKGKYTKYLEDFGAEDLGALVGVVGSSSTEILLDFDSCDLYEEPFWKALRDSVVPACRLRSSVVRGIARIKSDIFESRVAPLVQLAGSLEELELQTVFPHDPEPFDGEELWLPRFPASFFGLKKLRRLVLVGHPLITGIPAEISSLKELEDLNLGCNNLSSLPKELGELSGLTWLNLSYNKSLGNRPYGEAFPAELGKMKSLRYLDLSGCGLRTIPGFVGKLTSLEVLNLFISRLSSLPKELGELSGLTKLKLSYNRSLGNAAFPAELGKMKSLRELRINDCGLRTVPAFLGELESLEVLDVTYNDHLQIDAPLDFLIKGCSHLRAVDLEKRPDGRPWTPQSLARLEAFKARLLAQNPVAKVEYKF